MAINDKSVPKAIRNLSYTMNMVIVCLLALAISEFTIISNQFNAINENFNLIEQSFLLISEFQRIAFDVRTLILINEEILVNYQNYSTVDDFPEYLKEDMTEALDSLYALQSNISISGLDMSETHRELYDNKTIVLQFREEDGGTKDLNFTLAEAVL